MWLDRADWAHNPEVAGSNPAPATKSQVAGPEDHLPGLGDLPLSIAVCGESTRNDSGALGQRFNGCRKRAQIIWFWTQMSQPR
jgi:hypothetical protein